MSREAVNPRLIVATVPVVGKFAGLRLPSTGESSPKPRASTSGAGDLVRIREDG